MEGLILLGIIVAALALGKRGPTNVPPGTPPPKAPPAQKAAPFKFNPTIPAQVAKGLLTKTYKAISVAGLNLNTTPVSGATPNPAEFTRAVATTVNAEVAGQPNDAHVWDNDWEWNSAANAGQLSWGNYQPQSADAVKAGPPRSILGPTSDSLASYILARRAARDFIVADIPQYAKPVLFDDNHADWSGIDGVNPQTAGGVAARGGPDWWFAGDVQHNAADFYNQIHAPAAKLPASWLDGWDWKDAGNLIQAHVIRYIPPPQMDAGGGLFADYSQFNARERGRTDRERGEDESNLARYEAVDALSYIGSLIAQVVNAFVPGTGGAINTLFKYAIVDPIKMTETWEHGMTDAARVALADLLIDTELVYLPDGSVFRRRKQLFQLMPVKWRSDGAGWLVPWLNTLSGAHTGDWKSYGDYAAATPVKTDNSAGDTYGSGDIVVAKRVAAYVAPIYRLLDVMACRLFPRMTRASGEADAGFYYYQNPRWGNLYGSIFPPTDEDWIIPPTKATATVTVGGFNFGALGAAGLKV